MADLTRLIELLDEYQRVLDRHRALVASRFTEVQSRHRALEAVYDGEAATTFKAGWRHTREAFEAYTDAIARLDPLLSERLAALREADRGDP